MSDKLSSRQELILSLIVREYMQLPRSSGVSSKALVEKYDLSLSPATVRNEMAALAEAGMLYQPHTSAGRVPSDGGYRYFVQRLVQDDTLPAPKRVPMLGSGAASPLPYLRATRKPVRLRPHCTAARRASSI